MPSPNSPKSKLILSPLWVLRILSAIVLLTSKITIFETSFLGIKRGELGVELSGELVVDVDSSPFANVLCEKMLADVSKVSVSGALIGGPLHEVETSPFIRSSAQNRCGFCGMVFVT